MAIYLPTPTEPFMGTEKQWKMFFEVDIILVIAMIVIVIKEAK